jgi:uncharacterized integral membrane protein
MTEYNTAPDKKGGGLSGRAIGGIVIAINRDQVELSLLFFTVNTSLWVALTIAAVGGLLAGFLIGRKKYKR